MKLYLWHRVALFLISMPAFAADFCVSPHDFICKTESAIDRAKLIENFASPIKKHALDAAAEILHWEGGELTLELLRETKREKNLSREQKKRIRAALTVYFQELNRGVYAAVAKKLGGEEEILPGFHFEKIRGYLSEAISERVGDSALKAVMLERLQTVELADANQVLNLHNENVEREFEKNFWDGCGRDGLADNAFAFELRNRGAHTSRNLVVPCAGAIVASLLAVDTGGAEKSPFALALLMTLGHETGHHFDGNVKEFKDAYTRFRACVKATRGGEMKPEKEGQSPDEIIESHIGEISADYWGTEVVARFLREHPSTDVAAALRYNYSDICDSSDDGVHPPGAMRMEFARDQQSFFDGLRCNGKRPGDTPRCEL